MANHSAAELFGCSTVQELKENHVATDFYSSETRSELISRLRKQGTVQGKEIELDLPNGNKTWIRANFKLNCLGECIECFLMDITEVVKLREQHFQSLKILSEKIDSQMESLAG